MIRRGLLVVAVLAGAAALVPTAATAATASVPAATPAVHGWMAAGQDTFTHRLTVRGSTHDAAASSRSISVEVFVDGTYVRTVPANGASVGYDRTHHITGRHHFRTTFTWTKRAGTVTVRTRGADAKGAAVVVRTHAVTHTTPGPGPGARIVAIAAKYVGKARYVEDGASPSRGFDCSGYTQYVYAQAKVATLPHNAQAQRLMKGMRHISAASARPGDLVFYLSGGSAYHVAIYAGHHMQYAAATPKDGIRYQQVWSTAVTYATDWH